MTRQKLKQIRHLKREIELLQEQILRLDAEVVTDKVRGSDPRHPYTEKSFYITGFDREELSQKMERLKRKMQRRVDDLMELREEILEFVEGIGLRRVNDRGVGPGRIDVVTETRAQAFEIGRSRRRVIILSGGSMMSETEGGK